MRELRIGEAVTGSDGGRLGEVERMVVDESTHRVTHLVVDGHVVALARFRDSGEDDLIADLDRDSLQRLPHVEHGHVVAPGEHWEAPAGRVLGDFLAIAGALIGQSPYIPPVHADFETAGVHQITTGSPVWSGQERLGEVERVVTDDAGALADLVIRRSEVLAPAVWVPAARIVEVIGNNVHTDLSPEEIEGLQKYEHDG